MSSAECARCGRPTDAYVCAKDAHELGDALLAAAGHAEDAEAVLARQVRYGAGGRAGSTDATPGNLTAADRIGPIANAIGGWARIVSEETGTHPRWRLMSGPLCPPTGTRCPHDSCEIIRRWMPPSPLARDAAWLARQTGWLRRHPAAAEAFTDLHDACEALARLVDRPADKELVGMCDCGRVLYAPRGKTVVVCPVPTCKLRWNVEQSRDILRRALDDKLVTAADAARLAQYLDSERTRQQIRNLINKWAERGLVEAHADIGGEPAYRFGDIADRLARTPRRARQAA